jgi:hypothetical protein
MAKKKGKKSPTPKAKAAYNKLIVKAHKRLTKVLKENNPKALEDNLKGI